MNEINLQTVELGHPFTHAELLKHFRAVWGGVSWPGKRPGFAVVVGMVHGPHFDNHDIFLLEEYESFDMRKLIRQCGAMDVKYGIGPSRSYRPDSPGRWVGDYKNDAASRFIAEINSEQNRDGSVEGREPLSLTPTGMLEMQSFYTFALSAIKELLNAERRTLYLKDSKVLSYLSEIEDDQIAELELGDYPAIEALAFAVIEIRDAQQAIRMQRPQSNPWGDDNFLTRGLRKRRR